LSGAGTGARPKSKLGSSASFDDERSTRRRPPTEVILEIREATMSDEFASSPNEPAREEAASLPSEPVRDEAATLSDEPDRGGERPESQPAKKSLFDDLSALRLDGTDANVGAVEVLVHIPVRKPNRQEYFLVHRQFVLATTVFTDKEERESYLVTPAMRGALVGEARAVLLVPAITRQNVLIIWPVPLPSEDGRRNRWTDTAQEAMHLAQEKWVRLVPDMGLGAYRIYLAEGQLSDPIWPDKAFEELLEIAFKDRVIDTSDHPVVRRLRGLT
jgi:hypothetical protein